MKAAISAAVTTFAQAAGSWRDRDTATIEALRRENHDLANRVQKAEGALELLAVELALDRHASPAQVLAAILVRLK